MLAEKHNLQCLVVFEPASQMLEYSKKYTLEHFNQEWARKIELLRSHI